MARRAAALLLLALCAIATAEQHDGPLPKLQVSGSNFEVGRAAGAAYAAEWNAYLAAFSTLQDKLLPFVATPEGHQVFDSLVQTQRAAFPQYYEEVQGMANGSSVPLDTLLVVSLRDELETYMDHHSAQRGVWPARVEWADRGARGCSDVVGYSSEALFVAHNEDAMAAVTNTSALLDAAVPGAPRFVAFTYPAHLPGLAFGVNSAGVAVTLNAEFPTAVQPTGLGKHWLARSLLDATSVDDALHRLTHPGSVALGMSVNLVSSSPPRAVNVELAVGGYSVQEVSPRPPQPPSYFHANMYRRLPVAQRNDTSSVHRLQRALQLMPASTPAAALALLGDTQDASWPIFRDSSPPDTDSTVATMLFDAAEGRFDVFRANPASSRPVATVYVKDLA